MKQELARDIMRWMGVFAFAGMLGWWAVTAAAQPVQTVSAQPVTAPAPAAYRVVVDAGHGGQDGGTVGVSGVPEAPLNLAVAHYLQQELEKRDVEVILTRKDDNALAGTKRKDMAARREIIRTPGVDAVVSIHMNHFGDASISGPMVFYMKGSRQGQLLATEVIDALCDRLGQSRRLANPGDYFMVRECQAPAVIVECGFLSNREEDALLQQSEYQQKLAKAICDGVLAYLEGKMGE